MQASAHGISHRGAALCATAGNDTCSVRMARGENLHTVCIQSVLVLVGPCCALSYNSVDTCSFAAMVQGLLGLSAWLNQMMIQLSAAPDAITLDMPASTPAE